MEQRFETGGMRCLVHLTAVPRRSSAWSSTQVLCGDRATCIAEKTPPTFSSTPSTILSYLNSVVHGTALPLSIYRTGALSVGMRVSTRLLPCNTFPFGVIHHEIQRAASSGLSFMITSSRPSSGHTGAAATATAATAAATAAAPESGHGGERDSYFERKMALRKRIKLELRAMSQSAVDAASSAVAARLLASSQLAEGTGDGGAVSIYLAMPGELHTQAIVNELFKRGKKVYIPKVGSPAMPSYYDNSNNSNSTMLFYSDISRVTLWCSSSVSYVSGRPNNAAYLSCWRDDACIHSITDRSKARSYANRKNNRPR